jgi:hypothetical protein
MKKLILIFFLSLPAVLFAQETITITVNFSGTPTAVNARKALYKYDKTAAFLYQLDDNANAMRNVSANFAGGTAPINGVTYSGRTFTDGCGNNVKWRAGLATNAKLQSDNSDYVNAGTLTWAEKASLITNHFTIENHGYYHNTTGTFNFGTNWRENVLANHNYIYDSLAGNGKSFVSRTFVVPNADFGHFGAADSLGYISGVTQGDNPGGYISRPLGNGEQPLKVDTIPFSRFLVYNRSLKDGWDASAVAYYEGTITNNFLNGRSTSNHRLWCLGGHYFSNVTEWNYFLSVMDYMQASGEDDLWATSVQEFAEYREVYSKVYIEQHFENNVLKIRLNYNEIPDINRFRDLSLIINHTGGTITSVTSDGADNISYSASTGLINIFKEKSTGFTDPIPPANGCGGIKRFVVAAVGDTGAYFPNGTSSLTYNPGDTIIFNSAYYTYIYFKNFKGTPGCPVTVINRVGGVRLSGDIKLDSCKYIHWTGTGDPQLMYGFSINGTTGQGYHPAGEGLSFKSLDKNIEVDHIKVKNKTYVGAMKNESVEIGCDQSLWWPARYDSMNFHHIFADTIFQDGWYMLSSDPYNVARPIVCGGVTIYPMPTGGSNITFHHNTFFNGYRSALQWGGTDAGTNTAYENYFKNWGLEHNDQQGAGLAIGSKTTNFFAWNNTIKFTYKPGLFSYHYGVGEWWNNYVDSSGYVSDASQSNQSSFIMNTFNPQNPLPTTFVIRNNYFGTNTSTAARVIELLNSTNNYGSPNFICNNSWKGVAVTNTDIFKENTQVTWGTTCAVLMAYAGVDQSITIDSAFLGASSVPAPGHSITGYSWQKISGPGATSIPNPNRQGVIARSLVTGTYVFRVTVTQDDSSTVTDDITITVNGSIVYPSLRIPGKKRPIFIH